MIAAIGANAMRGPPADGAPQIATRACAEDFRSSYACSESSRRDLPSTCPA